MTIVDSLKKLLVKFGGNPSALEENATSSDVIDAITEAYTDKEGTYTEVTPIGSEGTKIATITTNNTAHDIYTPKELPAATSEDAGMVLSVNSEGAWAKANPLTELPAVTSADEGDVLGVNASGEWVKTTPSGSTPTPTTSNAGSILAVKFDGTWELQRWGGNWELEEFVVGCGDTQTTPYLRGLTGISTKNLWNYYYNAASNARNTLNFIVTASDSHNIYYLVSGTDKFNGETNHYHLVFKCEDFVNNKLRYFIGDSSNDSDGKMQCVYKEYVLTPTT